MSHQPLPGRSARLSWMVRLILCVFGAGAMFLMQACVLSPDEKTALAQVDTLFVTDTLTLRDTVLKIDSARILDGNWEFIGGISYWDENGETGIDTLSIDTTNPFERQFYLIGGGLLVWMHYDENSSEHSTAASAHSFHRLGGGRWVVDSEDTLTAIRHGDEMTFIMVSIEENYDSENEQTYLYTYRDSLTFRLYRGDFPLAAWLSGLSPEDYPVNVTPVAADGSAVEAYLDPEEADWYRFTGTAGETYRMGTTGEVDTYMSLYNISTGEILAQNDDDGAGANAMIVWTCPASGDYHLKVRGFGPDDHGEYGLIVGPDGTTVFPVDTVDTVDVNPLDSLGVLPRVAAPVSKPKPKLQHKSFHPLLDLLQAAPVVH